MIVWVLPYWEGFYHIIGEVLLECKASAIGLQKPVAIGIELLQKNMVATFVTSIAINI